MLHLLNNKNLLIASGAFLLFAVIGLVLLITSNSASIQKPDQGAGHQFPQSVGYINDFGRLLTDEEEKTLTKIAFEFEQRTSAQLVVVTVETLSPFESVETYATKLFNTWGIGQKDKNNGVLLLIAIKERKVRIEVGLGLEKTLPDAKCKEILQTEVTPRLKESAFYEAVKSGMQSIITELEKQ